MVLPIGHDKKAIAFTKMYERKEMVKWGLINIMIDNVAKSVFPFG